MFLWQWIFSKEYLAKCVRLHRAKTLSNKICKWFFTKVTYFLAFTQELKKHCKYYLRKYICPCKLSSLSMFSMPNHICCKSNKWAATWQNQQSECAPSEDSDQPGHSPSQISVFAVRMKKHWVLSYPLSAQRRLWSVLADAQADLSLR